MQDVLWVHGARNTLKLDGGGSSGLYFNDGAYSFAWNGGREVANAWVIVPYTAPPSPTPPPAGSWHVEYFSDRNLGGRCYDGEGDSRRTLQWADRQRSRPFNDSFSARFTRTMNFSWRQLPLSPARRRLAESSLTDNCDWMPGGILRSQVMTGADRCHLGITKSKSNSMRTQVTRDSKPGGRAPGIYPLSRDAAPASGVLNIGGMWICRVRPSCVSTKEAVCSITTGAQEGRAHRMVCLATVSAIVSSARSALPADVTASMCFPMTAFACG
ncbi:MAG: hypothetical protein IPG14_10225, partial [Dehalococcoidia bacterium]|nr:hypothetical protein [Dehalococcoidia bacterium]